MLGVRQQSAWGFVKTAEKEVQQWVTTSISFWRLSCVKPKLFFSERVWGKKHKKHLLILSNDKTTEQNFAKLCVLNFFLLDVSLSFIAGCKAVAQSAADRPKKNYGLKYSRTLYVLEQMWDLIEEWSQAGVCISILLKSQIYKHLESTHGHIFKINMHFSCEHHSSRAISQEVPPRAGRISCPCPFP